MVNSEHIFFLASEVGGGCTVLGSSLTAPIAQLVERPLSEREVVGSNPGRTIPKV